MAKTLTAPPSDLVTQRKHVGALGSERATLPARLRQASAAGDAATVQTLLTRREMVPTLIAEGRAALVPLEIAAIDADLAAVAREEVGVRAAVDEADQARAQARQAVFEAEKRYASAQARFTPLDNRREALHRQRHALTTAAID